MTAPSDRPSSGPGDRLLYVDVKWPTPDRDAASQRTVQLLTRLVSLGFAVDFAAMFPAVSDAPIRLCDFGVRALSCPDEAAVLDHVARFGHGYEVVVLTWTRVARRLLDAVREANPGAFIVFDTVDVNHVREYRHARVSGNAGILRRALIMKQHELAAVRGADCTVAVTPVDADKLQAACPGARVEVLTLLPPIDPLESCPGPEGRRGLLCVGSLQASANVDAALHLVADILPGLRRRACHSSVSIVGGDPPSVVSALASPHVRVLGHVSDLAPLFGSHRVFVCPLRFGSGLKGKLLLAMAMGLPAIATPIAVEGLGAVAGRDVLMAETPDEWAEAVRRLQQDDELWLALSRAGRRLMATRHNGSVLDAQVRRVFCRPP